MRAYDSLRLERMLGASSRLALLFSATAIATACGSPSPDDLFGETGKGGHGGGSAAGTTTTTTSTTSSSVTTSSSSSASSASSSSSSSSSSGGLVCGDGVCSPGEQAVFCPQDCSMTSCQHTVCNTGPALPSTCDPCAAAVCAADAYCCDTDWDGMCVAEASSTCGACCGNGVCDNTEDCQSCPADCACAPLKCPHSVCLAGDPLDPAICHDPCTTQVCAQKPECCTGAGGSWDASCEMLASQLCGGPDPCVGYVCASMPSCCASGWTQACIDKAKTTCQTGCDCAHSICQEGETLTADCNPCAKAVCAADMYCCTAGWDGYCVAEVEAICGINCQ